MHLKLISLFLFLIICTPLLLAQHFDAKMEEARATYQSGNIEVAMAQIEAILNDEAILDTPKFFAEAVTLKGTLLREHRDFINAEAQHSLALKVREKTFGKNSLEAARSLSNLGNIALELEDFNTAKNYFSQSLSIHHEIGTDKKGEAFSPILGLAKMALGNEDIGNAKMWFDQLKTQIEISKSSQKERAFNSLLIAYFEANDQLAVADSLSKATKSFYENNPFLKAEFLLKNAQIKISQLRLNEAEIQSVSYTHLTLPTICSV